MVSRRESETEREREREGGNERKAAWGFIYVGCPEHPFALGAELDRDAGEGGFRRWLRAFGHDWKYGWRSSDEVSNRFGLLWMKWARVKRSKSLLDHVSTDQRLRCVISRAMALHQNPPELTQRISSPFTTTQACRFVGV